MFSYKISVKRDEVIGWSTKGPSNLIFLGYEFVTGHFAKKKICCNQKSLWWNLLPYHTQSNGTGSAIWPLYTSAQNNS